MIETIPAQNSLLEAALYYIRLDAHSAALRPEEETLAMSFAQIAADELQSTAERKGVTIKQWTVCSEAIHALVYIDESRLEQNYKIGKPRALTAFVAGVKAATAKRINLVRNQPPGQPVWKRSYRQQRVESDRMLSQLVSKMTAAAQ